MKLFARTLIFAILILSLFIGAVPGFAEDGTSQRNAAQERILVKFKEGTDTSAKQAMFRRFGDAAGGEISRIGVSVVTVPASKLLQRLQAYKNESAVVFAEPDYVAYAIGTPNDTYYANQWGLDKVQCPQAWDINTGSSDIKIAILDSGIDQNHQDLASKIVANKNYTSSRTVDDKYGHGTHVAGIAAAVTNNNLGVAGVGYNSSLMNVKVIGDSGSGYYSWIANGIIWAADNGAKVINMSLGSTSASSTLENAVNYASNKGVVLVAAAGNNSNTTAFYPAYYSNVLSVAATDSSDSKASFSNYGSWVKLAAPGVDIYATLPNHSNRIGTLNYGYLSGTSMASPFVAGLAGLVWTSTFSTDRLSVIERIQDTADEIDGTGVYWQYGRINTYKAVGSVSGLPPALSLSLTAPSITNQSSFIVKASVTNTGDEMAEGVNASIVLPSGLTTATPTVSLGDIGGKASAEASWSVTTSADGTYNLVVNATADNASTDSGSAAVSVDTTPPAQVTGLAVSVQSSSQLNLNWNLSADVDYYKVYRGTDEGGPYTLVASPTANSYQDTGLAANTSYYYVVSAVDGVGNEGARSTEASGKTSAATLNALHIKSIAMVLQSSWYYKRAAATMTITDAAGNAVSSASVSGHWSGATTDTDTGTTNTSGQITLYSNYTYARSGTTFIFTVDNVARSGWTYDAAANVETSDSVKVP